MRHTLGLALAAGLLALLPASSARAQAAYGYDSWIYNVPSGAGYWNGTGYSGVYTDQSTVSFAGETVAPYRGVAPYAMPPAVTYGSTDGLAHAAPPQNFVQLRPAQPARRGRVPRRGLIGRRGAMDPAAAFAPPPAAAPAPR